MKINNIYQNKKKYSALFTLIVILIILFIFLINSIRPEPLVQLSNETINKLLAASVRNLVLFNREARPVQIIDFFHEQAVVRPIEGLVKYMKMEKIQDVRASKKMISFTKNMILSEKSPLQLVVNETKVSTKNQDNLVASLSIEEALSLRANGVFYLEYRDAKDQEIQVIELTEKGFCVPCLVGHLPKSSIYQDSSLQKKENSLLDYVIPAAQACTHGLDCGCSSGNCKRVGVNRRCCNC